MNNDEFYWYWLCNISGIGNLKIKALLDAFETPKEIYGAGKKLLEMVNGIGEECALRIAKSTRKGGIYEEFCRLKDMNIHFTHPGKEDYPCQFEEMYDKPYGVYYKGKLPNPSKPVVSIIGARGCTEYGRTAARHFGKEFSRMGIQIVSGMALGIDTAGHRGALEQGGYTLAVLGCGVDVCYPRENIGMYKEISETGGIMSEYPPGTSPIKGQFPMRNRLISALSDAVVVVEARKKSGSLITVDQALDQNKDVFVIPGRINDPLSEGCNRLIQMGAQMLIQPEDIFSNNKIFEMCNNGKIKECADNNSEKNKIGETGLASKKNMLYSCVDLPILFYMSYIKSLKHA